MYYISFECGSEKSQLLNVSSSVYSARRQETAESEQQQTDQHGGHLSTEGHQWSKRPDGNRQMDLDEAVD